MERLFDCICNGHLPGKTEEAKCIIDSAAFDVDAVTEVASPTDMHSSLCLTRTLFSRLLEWRDGSHSCGTQWICRDRDDAGGERYKAQSPRQGEPSFALHLSPPALYDAFFILP